MSTTLRRVTLSAGEIEFADSGGSGPALVLLHGLMMDHTLWDGAIARLDEDFRCVVPRLPLGAHAVPVYPEADLSLAGVADLVLELIDELGLEEVALVGNDTGGALAQLIVRRASPRVTRLVLVSCEAFDNWPPGLTGRTLLGAGRLAPPLFGVFMQQLRLKIVRRAPFAFGSLTKRGDGVVRGWLRPVLADPVIRRDTTRLLRTIAAEGPALQEASESLAAFAGASLVVWAGNDRVMPIDHAQRLADLLPDARKVVIEDSYTLIPLDQPDALASSLREFAGRA